MSFGDGDLHVIVAQLKTENARLKQRNGEMKVLMRDMYDELRHVRGDVFMFDYIEQRVSELMEVDA